MVRKGDDKVFMELTIKLLLGFVFLFITTKFVGKTTIKQLTPFDFLGTLILGEILGNALFDEEVRIVHVFYATFVWGGLIIGSETLTLKFKGLRSFLEGNPSIIIRKGVVNRKELRKAKMNLNQLQSLLRQNKVISIREVEYAILEPNGEISFIKKSKYQNPTLEDLNLQKSNHIPVTLILDGEIVDDNMKSLNKGMIG
jgi:uncharacterized membrane protein YcaP (DUF421 family)